MTHDEFDAKAMEIIKNWPSLLGECNEDGLAASIAQALRDADQAGYRRGKSLTSNDVTRSYYCKTRPPEPCWCEDGRHK